MAILERLVRTPYLVRPNPMLLQLDPRWDALRQNPRFRALVESP